MSTITIAPGLYAWKLTLTTGEVRHVTASSLASAIGALPVVAAEREGAITEVAPPVLSSLNPATAIAAAPDVTLHAIGTGFAPSDQIWWNGAPVATTFVSATELTAVVVVPGAPTSVLVQVRDVLGAESAPQTFTVTSA